MSLSCIELIAKLVDEFGQQLPDQIGQSSNRVIGWQDKVPVSVLVLAPLAGLLQFSTCY